MSKWLRLHVPPRSVRRWMYDAGIFVSHMELRKDAPPRIRWLMERSWECWARRPDGVEFLSALRNTLESGVLTTYHGTLFIENWRAA